MYTKDVDTVPTTADIKGRLDEEKGRISFEVVDAEPGLAPEADQPFTLALAFACLVASIGSFQYGWHAGSTSIVMDVMRCSASSSNSLRALPRCLNMNTDIWAFFNASFALGGLFGGIVANLFMSKMGRIQACHLCNALFGLAALLLSLAPHPAVLILGRSIAGIAAGAQSSIVPTYVAEISPPRWRGALGCSFGFQLSTGVLVAQLLSIALNFRPGWRVLCGLTGVWAGVMSVGFLWCPEGPRYLVMSGKREEASRALMRLRGSDAVGVEGELQAIIRGIEAEQSGREDSKTLSLMGIIRSPVLRKPLFLAGVIHLAQQLSGINPIVGYAAQLFSRFMAPSTAMWLAVALTGCNNMGIVVSSTQMNRVGRRRFFLISVTGMAVSIALVVMFAQLNKNIAATVLLLIAICFYALGLGPIPWLITSELFPATAIGSASSFAATVNWTFNFVLTYAFADMQSGMGNWSLLVFAGGLVVVGVVLGGTMPETTGRGVEEVVEGFEGGWGAKGVKRL
ncbi:hypothetical protein YB2330_005815 [Saitoella coloradoensis]